MENRLRRRKIWAFCLLLTGFLGMAGHLAYIMVYRHDFYAVKALNQQSQLVPLEMPMRGDILDRNLQPLTNSREESRIVVFPGVMQDKTAVTGKLAQILGLNEQDIERDFGDKPGLLPMPITSEQAGRIKASRLQGVLVGRFRQRNGLPELADHVVGYVGKVSTGQELETLRAMNREKSYSLGDWVGKMGLEYYFDGELKGTTPLAGARTYVDGKGRSIPGLGYKLENGLTDAARHNLVLTINKKFQQQVEAVLDERGIRAGAITVMDPNTGDILAMASRPGFSLHQEGEEQVRNSVYTREYNGFMERNTRLFQPGSVFKVVVAAAALEEGVAKPESRFLCLGDSDEYVSCYEPAGHGQIDFNKAMAISCNPTFARLGLRVGAEKLIDYARRFGMDKQEIIGYPYPADRRQNLAGIAEPYNLVNSSLGQGPVLASPVQITAMMAAVADNGIYREPRLVSEIRDYTGQVTRSFSAAKGKRAVSGETAAELQRMLEEVTLNGTGKSAYIENGGSAGKTGSAQISAAGTSVDAWFSGYAPVSNPRFVVTVMIEQGESGGKTAAPVFRAVMERLLAFPRGSGQ